MEVTKITIKENRMIAGRLLPETDLIQGLKEECRKNNIENGQIISCIGSLKKATYIYAVDDEDNKIKIKYCEPVIVEGPLELITCQGTIGHENGDISIHLHGMFSDKHTNIYGGHFYETGNIVLATAEFVILGFKAPVISRQLDSETGFNLLKFNELKE